MKHEAITVWDLYFSHAIAGIARGRSADAQLPDDVIDRASDLADRMLAARGKAMMAQQAIRTDEETY